MYSSQMSQDEFKSFGDILVCTPQVLETLMTSSKDCI